jgi:hypothetical protein
MSWDKVHRKAIELEDNRTEFLQFLKEIIPCTLCDQHYMSFVQVNDPLKAKSLFEWSVEYHNSVNESIGKEKISVEDARLNFLLK